VAAGLSLGEYTALAFAGAFQVNPLGPLLDSLAKPGNMSIGRGRGDQCCGQRRVSPYYVSRYHVPRTAYRAYRVPAYRVPRVSRIAYRASVSRTRTACIAQSRHRRLAYTGCRVSRIASSLPTPSSSLETGAAVRCFGMAAHVQSTVMCSAIHCRGLVSVEQLPGWAEAREAERGSHAGERSPPDMFSSCACYTFLRDLGCTVNSNPTPPCRTPVCPCSAKSDAMPPVNGPMTLVCPCAALVAGGGCERERDGERDWAGLSARAGAVRRRQ